MSNAHAFKYNIAAIEEKWINYNDSDSILMTTTLLMFYVSFHGLRRNQVIFDMRRILHSW